MIIEKGTIKVVWASKTGKKIYSKMFEKIKQADKFGRTKKDYIIFQLVKHKRFREFEWKLLPYGEHKIYEKFVHYYYKGHIDRILRLAEKL